MKRSLWSFARHVATAKIASLAGAVRSFFTRAKRKILMGAQRCTELAVARVKLFARSIAVEEPFSSRSIVPLGEARPPSILGLTADTRASRESHTAAAASKFEKLRQMSPNIPPKHPPKNYISNKLFDRRTRNIYGHR